MTVAAVRSQPTQLSGTFSFVVKLHTVHSEQKCSHLLTVQVKGERPPRICKLSTSKDKLGQSRLTRKPSKLLVEISILSSNSLFSKNCSSLRRYLSAKFHCTLITFSLTSTYLSTHWELFQLRHS